MAKQVSLNNFMVVASNLETGKQTCSERLTAIIVKLEPAVYGRCSLCNRWTTLGFCIEYLNSQGAMTLWGEICQECKQEWEKRRNSLD